MPEVHIRVRLASTFPSARELELCTAVEEVLHDGVGQVIDAGAGGGGMDVFLQVERADVVIDRIEQIVEGLGLTGRTDVVVKPPLIKVLIQCAEDEFPEDQDLVPRDALLRAIEAGRIGRWTMAGQEPGLMDVWIEVKDPAEAVAKLQAVVTQLGIGDRTRILAE